MTLRAAALITISILSITVSRARPNILIRNKSNTYIQDTLRDEFNLKKKNITNLIKGKSSKDMLSYYEFYLQAKDYLRSDSLITELLKSENSVDYKHKISLISYRYTADPKTQMLFLSDPERIKEYRAYFLKFEVSSLKSNVDNRTYYYNLVSLDSAYYTVVPDSLVRKQLSHNYNNLAWYNILTRDFNEAEYDLNQSIKFDPQYKYPHSNLALVLLLEGKYLTARALYIKYKDQPFDRPNSTFKDKFLEDFKEIAEVGITNKRIKEIKKLLNSQN